MTSALTPERRTELRRQAMAARPFTGHGVITDPRTTVWVTDLLALLDAADQLDAITPQPGCPTHRPVQHRDGKVPWCHACGLTADYQEPGSLFARTE